MSTIYRVHWTPGTDRLLAVCHCGSWHEVEDPIEAWEWLLAHPDGHTGPAAGSATGPPRCRSTAPVAPIGDDRD